MPYNDANSNSSNDNNSIGIESTAKSEQQDGKDNVGVEEKKGDGGGREGEQPGEEEEEELVIEQPLFTIKEVFVYRVPTLRASSGHRAEEWGLADPVFTGEQNVITHST